MDPEIAVRAAAQRFRDRVEKAAYFAGLGVRFDSLVAVAAGALVKSKTILTCGSERPNRIAKATVCKSVSCASTILDSGGFTRGSRRIMRLSLVSIGENSPRLGCH